jgi:outer membrane protein assembly factor BamD (BamD/ComL family)
MLVRERVTQAIENLNEDELQRVAEFLDYLRYRERVNTISTIDSTLLAELYAEFGDKDRSMAEEGMDSYLEGLKTEDIR